MSTGRGNIQVEAGEIFFNAKLPAAIICISTRENIIESWTIGQNLPAVSYFGAYTFMNCIIQKQWISASHVITSFPEPHIFKTNKHTKKSDLVSINNVCKTEIDQEEW